MLFSWCFERSIAVKNFGSDGHGDACSHDVRSHSPGDMLKPVAVDNFHPSLIHDDHSNSASYGDGMVD